MRSTSNTIINLFALLLACMMIFPGALAVSMDDNLTLAMISVKTDRLNPLDPQEREFQSLTALMYEGLFSIDDDYRPVPCLAKSCAPDRTGKTWVVTLREDACFWDGTRITAYDAAATIQEILRLAEEGKGQYAQIKYIITDASANDASSLRITVSRPYYGVYYALTFPVLPASQVQADNPQGTGPYMPDSFSPGAYLYLSANPLWHEDPPAVRTISVLFEATNRELIEDYEFNTVDAAITRSASAGQYRTGLTNLNIPYRTRQLETLLMNARSASFPLDDIRVRKAIRYAIDADAIAATVYSGTAVRTDTPIPYGTWMYQDTLGAYEYNPEKAKQLLAEAGWGDDDEDGVLDMVVDGKPRRLHLRFWVYEEQDNTVREQAATMISAMLKEVGIETEQRTLSFSTVQERLTARNFDLVLAAFQMDVVPDPGFLLMSGNTCNYGNYKSAKMDELFKQFRAAMDSTNYENLLHKIQEQFAEDCPFICLYYRCGALLTRKAFTASRDIREPEILRGIESIGN